MRQPKKKLVPRMLCDEQLPHASGRRASELCPLPKHAPNLERYLPCSVMLSRGQLLPRSGLRGDEIPSFRGLSLASASLARCETAKEINSTRPSATITGQSAFSLLDSRTEGSQKQRQYDGARTEREPPVCTHATITQHSWPPCLFVCQREFGAADAA
jgi:hypothetical protein